MATTLMAKMTKASLFALVTTGLCLAAGACSTKGTKDITFWLGSNIVETAKRTGIPKFSVSNTDGLIQYGAMQLPLEANVIYDRAGYEVSTKSVFSINFSADRARTPNDLVTTFSVRLDPDLFESHTRARAQLKNLLTQFKSGKWKRYIAPDCPKVKGRSSYLDENGHIDSEACGLDPDYEISDTDWAPLFASRKRYEWLGDDVLAQVTAEYRMHAQTTKYEIEVNFYTFGEKLAVEKQAELEHLKEGDAQGWNSSAKAIAAEKAITEKNRVLEANALKRGETVEKIDFRSM